MEPLVFVILAPIAAILMLVVALVAWRRRDESGGWALVLFSAVELGWLLCDTLALLASTPEATVLLTEATFLFAPLLGVAWLAFVLSYTERFTRLWRTVVGGLTAWSVIYGAMALSNTAHDLVWSSWEVVPYGAFTRVAYTLGPLAWAQTVFAWSMVIAALGMILWAYASTNARARDLSRWIAAGAIVPLVLNVVFLLSLGPLVKDFTPIAMAVSSAAFALGLARYQLLDLRPIARAALVDDLPDGMLVLDTRGRVADANPAMCGLLDSPESFIGSQLRTTAPRLNEAIAAARDQPFCVGSGEDARYFDLRVSPLTDRAGRRSGHLVLLHDVTRRRRERAALARANADLYAANEELQARNDELDAFAHTVAHDLKNSIQGVVGYAEILRDDGPDLDAETHRLLADDLIRSGHKMDSIVHELLLLAGVRRAAVEMLPIDMGSVVEEALDRIRRARGASGAQVSCPSVWPVPLGHAPWVEEIWVNYLTNAAKYGGAIVTVGAEPTASGHARFWVHDDGPGLSPEAQARLFVPFSRVGAGEVEGHGLGLSIVRRIVERLGGTCGVESGPRLGTRFWFALPLAEVPDAVTG